MSRVIHFEIHASDPEPPIDFSAALQGWTFAKQEGMDHGLVALPKIPVPGLGRLADIKDPDGNVLGLVEPDPATS